jgi:hypothetical protein
MSIVSIQDLELYLQKDIQNTDDEEKYDYLIESVQEQAETICYRKFDEQEYTEQFDGNGGNELYLNQYPIFSVSDVQYGWTWSGSTRTEITEYLIYEQEGYLSFNFNSIEGNQVFEVTYIAGYADNPSASNNIPNDLKTILMDQIEISKNKTFTSGEIKKEKLGDYSYEKFGLDEMDNTSVFAEKLSKYVRNDI